MNMEHGNESSSLLSIPDNLHNTWWKPTTRGGEHPVPALPISQHGYIGPAELGELTRTFDQMVAMLVRLTAGREQMEKQVAERYIAEAALKQNLDELARTNQQLEEFTYIASHDLQEPLRKIQKFCELLERDLGTSLPDAARKDLAYINDGATRMHSLVLDLLAFSRLGREGVAFATFPLGLAVDRALNNLQIAIGEKHALVECDVLPLVTGNIELLSLLYQNLIGNALKYCEDSPRIRITAFWENDAWVYAVQDNGIGIDPAYAEQIFLPFKRLHGPERFPGSGLGLAICRKVTDIHHGTIWVQSARGQGADFRFTLNTAGPG